MTLQAPGPAVVDVGRVRAVYWPGDEGVATAYAEMADGATEWPGLPESADYPIRLIVVPNQAVFDSVTHGQLPHWGVGAAFPATNTIILRSAWDGGEVLRHELAHLAFRHAVRFAPRWFDEGYASRASGEWSRLDALRINWMLLTRRTPTLADVNRDLRAGAGRATAGYALATTVVLMLERLGGERGLEPLLTNLAEDPDLDGALRRTYGLTLDQFEQRWRRDLRSRYGLLSAATSVSLFWVVLALVVVAVWVRRRVRDRVRRAALDDGWVILDDGQTS